MSEIVYVGPKRYDRTPDQLAREREFMQSPARWPYETMLPMKRIHDGVRHGMLLVEPLCGNVRRVRPVVTTYDGQHTIEYESFEALQDDGWVID